MEAYTCLPQQLFKNKIKLCYNSSEREFVALIMLSFPTKTIVDFPLDAQAKQK